MDKLTYGELMDRARRHAHLTWTCLQEKPDANDLDVLQTVLTFRELIYAVAMLARLHLHSIPSASTMPFRTASDPRLHAAVRFADTLDAAIPGPRGEFHHVETGGVADHLRTAVVAVRAATELLATHLSDTGEWRTPQSAALDDTTARLDALESLASLAIELADARLLVLTFASEAGATQDWTRRHGLPGLAGVRETAGELRSLLWPSRNPTVINAATIANPGVHVGNPLTELADRVARMQLTAWRAAAYPGRESGVPALIDFATAGVMVHGRTAIVAARMAGKRIRDPYAPDLVKILLARADSWREVRAQVSVLNSASLPDLTLREDVSAVRRLLEQLTFDYAVDQFPGGQGVTIAQSVQPGRLMAGPASDITGRAVSIRYPAQHTDRMLILRSILLFVLAAVAEIGGAGMIWQGVREHRGIAWIGAGVLALGVYGFVATLQPDANFGRLLAAYGGIFVAGSLAWGMLVDGFRPDRWDILGALLCLAGVTVIMYGPRATDH